MTVMRKIGWFCRMIPIPRIRLSHLGATTRRPRTSLPTVTSGFSLRLMARSIQVQRWASGKGLAAWLMLALWMSLTLVTALPQLHHWFHHDSSAPRHECAATQISKGTILGGTPPPQFAPVTTTLLLPIKRAEISISFVSYSEPLTRGPPL